MSHQISPPTESPSEIPQRAPQVTNPDPPIWQMCDRVVTIRDRPLVMGIVNVTPDSFSDGGRLATTVTAVDHGLMLVEQGADLLDVGGESTRPGAEPIPLEEELRRVVPVVEKLAAEARVPISVDTSKAAVARACLAAGAKIINDVTALTGDPEMAEVVNDAGAAVILMHMQGSPRTMQLNPRYESVVREVIAFFEARLQALDTHGIGRERVVLDPGIGFGKTSTHNLELIRSLGSLGRFGRPVCLGVSRKGFIGKLLNDRPVERRLAASIAAACYVLTRQTAQILRVHDVEETKDAVIVISAVASAGGSVLE